MRARTRTIQIVVTAAAICSNLFGQARGTVQKTPQEKGRPAYEVLRQNEDWSRFASERDARNRPPFDSLKHLRLNGSGSLWASFGGQVRERVESWNQFDFGSPANAVHNDSFGLSRLLLHADLHFGETIRVFIQEKSAFSTRRALVGGRRTSDVDELDLQNAFVDFKIPFSDSATFTFRAGRQELLIGRQRLVGPSDWSNTRRTFDGFSGIVNAGTWNLTAFWTRPVKVVKYAFNEDDLNTEFYGLHSTGKVPTTKVGLDLYWYELKHKSAVYNGTAGPERRHTLGARVFTPATRSGFGYEFAGTYQFGTVGSHDISASMFLGQLAYQFPALPLTPRIYVGFDYASGSREKGGNVGTFNQLFPTAHATLGYADIVGRQNVIDVNCGVSFKPWRRLTVALDGYDFWRARENDALYGTSGAPSRPGGPGTPRKIGFETDLTLRFQLDRQTAFEAGYNHFFPGGFIQRTGPHQPVDFVYLALQYTF